MKLNLMGGVDISLPNISYCEDVKDVHYTPYNLVRFYVGEITTPQTVNIYTDKTNHIDVTVSEGNKWYTYVLPKDNGLYKIEGDSVKKVVVKVDINYHGGPSYYGTKPLIPLSTVEASFKGSNTSKVTNIESMFNKCSGLTSLDLRSFNTSNVTLMGGMFDGCRGLTSLDLSGWDTSKVTNMSYMFDYCIGLTSLDLSGWDTSKVTDMSSMFSNCTRLTSLDLRNFNTSNVTNMNGMFQDCTSLTLLDLRNFNTSNVTNMYGMFQDCTSLTSLDLSGWVISDVISNMYFMFNKCTALNEIKMIGCTQPTIDKIKAQLTTDGISLDNVNFVTE